MLRAYVPGRLPDGPAVQPLYGEQYHAGDAVRDADGALWVYEPRYAGDTRPWVCDE